MSNLDLYSSLVLKGEAEEIEIVSAYLEKLCLGININEASTSIYFKNVDKKKIDQIIRGCSNLVSWAWENIEVQDWMHNWKPYFKDVFIKDRVVIVPDWNKKQYSEKIVLKIDPGMAFGTGHHETTELMIRFILKYHEKNMDVLDLGTGSGILSILAYKLSSNKILSIDNDPVIESNFKKNMLINNSNAILSIDSCFNIQDFNYDLILANINKNILIDLIPQMISKKGFIVLSGILESDYDEILNIVNKNNFNVIDFDKINEWIGIVII